MGGDSELDLRLAVLPLTPLGEEQLISIRILDKIFDPNQWPSLAPATFPPAWAPRCCATCWAPASRGVVYPVNPKRESVQGIQAYKDVGSLPHVPDLAVICTPSPTVPGLIRSLGEAGTRGVVIISAGFREIGEPGGKPEADPRRTGEVSGDAYLGPNCLGSSFPAFTSTPVLRRRRP